MDKLTSDILRIIRLKELIHRVGLSRSSIYDRMNPNSPRYDVSFPKSIKLGGAAVGWVESTVDAWIQQRIDVAVNGLELPPETLTFNALISAPILFK
jgi:prophage regulatory protein